MNLLEYITEQGLKPVKRGMDWWMSCPFHRDDTPSLQVSEKDGKHIWYCFSCKRGGGPAAFMAELQGIPHHKARQKWAELAGEAAPEPGRVTLTSAVEALAVNGHPFLRGRGISDETCRKYGIGFCGDYGAFLKSVGLDGLEASRLGLFDFSGCLVYPFYDSDGVYKVAARSIEGKEYRNSPKESEYHKEGLWGLQAFRGEEAWVFEGYHDAMVASQMGYQALAAAGTRMSPAAWDELRVRGVLRVTFVPDGDAGGRSWLDRLSEDAPQDLLVEFVALQAGDPDDALLMGADLRKDVKTPFEWKVSTMPDGTLAERIRALRAASKAFLRMPRDQMVLSRSWFREKYGDDEALDFLRADRVPDVDAERVVIANCLCSTGIRLETVQELSVESFSTKLHRNVFTAVREGMASLQMVQVEFKADFSQYVDLENYRHYMDKVKDAGTRLKVSKILASAGTSDVGKTIESLYRVMDNVCVRGSGELARGLVERLNDRMKNPSVAGISIRGFATLNKVLMGWSPGRLVIISGNTGHGKTTLACNFIDGVIDEHGVLMVSLEMSEAEIMEKVVCIRSGVPSMKVTTGSLEQFEYDRVVGAAEELSRKGLHVVCGVGDLYKIIAMVRAYVARLKVRFVVIDFVQLVSVQSNEDRWQQLARIMREFKNQLCSTGITVFAVTQLARRALNSDLPDPADQAGAYAMLDSADVALAIRKENPSETKDGSNFVIHLGKNRFGLDGVVIPCSFDKVTQRICEITR